jgi:predicted nucleic acid-binding protein
VTRIADALARVSRLGIDTAPFIYLVERNPTYIDRVREIFRRIDEGQIEGYSSVVTLTEVLVHPRRHGNVAIEQEYRSILLQSRHVHLHPLLSSAAEYATDLRVRYNLRTPDAFQFAVSILSGCEAFPTNDSAHKRVTELRVLVLDDLEL